MAKAIKSYLHRGGDEPLLGATIPEHFDAIARKYADREAVACLHQNRRLTYDVFRVEIDRVARGLVGLGLSRGDRVGVWSTDNVEWLLLQQVESR